MAGSEIFDLPYFGIAQIALAGVPSLVARTGYTGEPGVEIMCPSHRATDVWDALHGRSGRARARRVSPRVTRCGWRWGTRSTGRNSA